MSVAVVGTERVRRRIRATGLDLDSAIERRVETSLLMLQEKIQGKLNNDVLNKQTGTLFRSIVIAMTRRGADSFGTVGTPIIYAKTHEYGATIKVKNADYLRFKVMDNWFAVKSVTIPARPFVRPSFEELRSEIVDGFAKTINQTVEKNS